MDFIKGESVMNLNVFYKEFSDCIFLCLNMNNRQYFIHTFEFKKYLFTYEEIPSKIMLKLIFKAIMNSGIKSSHLIRDVEAHYLLLII